MEASPSVLERQRDIELQLIFFFLALVTFIDGGERQEGDRENGEDTWQRVDELGVKLTTSRMRTVASIYGPPALTTAPPGHPCS